MEKIAEIFLYVVVFVTGLVIGRISMAVQYALMKPKKPSKTSPKPPQP